MADITFVCCYNDVNAFNKLVDNINYQDLDVSIIGIDNSSNKFTSCSSAYNSVIKKITTKYVAFSHQDISFIHSNTINQIIFYLSQTGTNDLIGVAGAKEEPLYKRKVLSNVIHGTEKSHAGSPFTGIEKCMTLDECLLFGHTEYFISNPFNEELCNNWHLYCVEQCLRTQINGGNVYVCDIEMLHESKGKVRSNYVRGFYKLCRYYHKQFPYITTCCASSRTTVPHLIGNCLIIEGSIFKRQVLKIR